MPKTTNLKSLQSMVSVARKALKKAETTLVEIDAENPKTTDALSYATAQEKVANAQAKVIELEAKIAEIAPEHKIHSTGVNTTNYKSLQSMLSVAKKKLKAWHEANPMPSIDDKEALNANLIEYSRQSDKIKELETKLAELKPAAKPAKEAKMVTVTLYTTQDDVAAIEKKIRKMFNVPEEKNVSVKFPFQKK